MTTPHDPAYAYAYAIAEEAVSTHGAWQFAEDLAWVLPQVHGTVIEMGPAAIPAA